MQYFDNNEKLKSEFRVINYKDIKFTSDLGVFAKDKIDTGSKLLAETYLKYGKRGIKALDIGCGYGFIGIILSKLMDIDFDMVDVNKRAIHLCEMNIKSNKVKANVFESNIYDNVKGKYDLIISNPPIRAGKEVYLKIIYDSFNFLNDDGELWFVMRTNHGVKTVIKNLKESYNPMIINKDCGFYIVKVVK